MELDSLLTETEYDDLSVFWTQNVKDEDVVQTLLDGEIVYLSDGGYSRVGWHPDSSVMS